MKYETLTDEDKEAIKLDRLRGLERDHYGAELDYKNAVDDDAKAAAKERLDDYAARIKTLKDS
jgi:hypothetical protein